LDSDRRLVGPQRPAGLVFRIGPRRHSAMNGLLVQSDQLSRTSANYIRRMSDYCASCPYNPKIAHGDNACPFSVLYWDFLDRNREHLSKNGRLKLAYRNLERMSDSKRKAVREDAVKLRKRLAAGNRM
jgi:deoxyribodipyrimidine photolyase-related protein